MQNSFLLFQRFSDEGLARENARILQEQAIHCVLEKDSSFFDPSFTTNHFDPSISLKVRADDFEKAADILENFYEQNDSPIDDQYYLNSFSNDELSDIVKMPDEWGPLDRYLAKKLLAQRGVPIAPEDLLRWKKQRIEQLAQPETSATVWSNIGFILAFVAPFFGIIVGWMLYTSKKNLPNGTRINSFGEKERAQGRIIMWLSGIFFVVWLLARLAYIYFLNH